MRPQPAWEAEKGVVLAGLAVAIMIFGALATVLLMRSTDNRKSSLAGMDGSRLLFVAEAGLNYNFVRMETDPLYAVKDLAGFGWDGAARVFRSTPVALGTSPGATGPSFELEIRYLMNGVPVAFASRAAPAEEFDEIQVTCSAASPLATRIVTARYAFRTDGAFSGAVVSDMTPLGTGGGKSGAMKGNIVVDGKGQHAIHGDLKANGSVLDGGGNPLDDASIGGYLAAWSGSVSADLTGTAEEVPDFTSLGGSDQLFDFDRFEAAAAGAGQIYTTIADFQAAMSTANLAGEKLEGVTVLKIDPAVEGGGPTIDLPGGVNVTGTLVLDFVDGTSPTYEVCILTALNINAADLTGFDASDESTFTTGYPGLYVDPAKMPSSVNIGPAFENFGPTSDLPALMSDNGVVDIHGPANVCGVVYGPSLIEIENEAPGLQYFNGAIFGGGGVYLRGHGSGMQAIRHDPNAVDDLETMGGKGRTLVRTDHAIVQ